LRLDSQLVGAICEKINSTGLYPYAVINADDQIVEARQFPKSAGYAEDPATGVAAAALSFSLLDHGILSVETCKSLFVRQGWSMGKPSEIQVQFRLREGNVEGCWISGQVRQIVAGDKDTE
jgi:predicted PhzF superfamily epimerase YddE/YHI9